MLPEYSIDVTDGAATSASKSAIIAFITQNELVATFGDTTVFSSKQLAIQSQLAPTNLEIIVSNVAYGRFEKNINPGITIASFTLAELNAGAIQFVHSGTENIPQFTLHFKDISTNYAFSRQIVGNTLLNHPPILINPTGTLNWPLNKASSYPVPDILFSDPDGQALQFSVRKLNDAPLPQWVLFDNVTNILTGTPQASGLYDFKIIVRDPYDETAVDRFAIDIKTNNGTIIIGEGTNPVPIVLAIGGGAALLGGCVAGGILFFKKSQDRKTRQQNEFARKIRHHLKLDKVDNFDTQKGQQFITTIQTLTNLLYDGQGIDIANMDDNQLDDLASKIAAAAKNKINPATVGLWKKSAITIQEFADNIEEIARDNRLLGHGDDVHIPMHTM